MNIDSRQLFARVAAIFEAEGVDPQQAAAVARNLVDANLTGHDSHGVVRMPRYIDAIRDGQINVHPNMSPVQEGPSYLLLDGDFSFGQVAGHELTGRLIDKAMAHGVAAGGVLKTFDVGRLGDYTQRAAQQQCLGLMAVNDAGWAPHIAPWGGSKPLLSTNPIAFSAPMTNRPPVCVDMATSICAGSQILLAHLRGQTLPPGLILDADGRPSTTPGDFLADPAGSVLPLGAPLAGHKGFALNIIVDILTGALSGAGCSGSGDRDAQGVFMLVIHIPAFIPVEQFDAHLEQLIQAIKTAPRQPGVDEIIIPGERAEREREKRLRDGIYIEDATWNEIDELAKLHGIE